MNAREAVDRLVDTDATRAHAMFAINVFREGREWEGSPEQARCRAEPRSDWVIRESCDVMDLAAFVAPGILNDYGRNGGWRERGTLHDDQPNVFTEIAGFKLYLGFGHGQGYTRIALDGYGLRWRANGRGVSAPDNIAASNEIRGKIDAQLARRIARPTARETAKREAIQALSAVWAPWYDYAELPPAFWRWLASDDDFSDYVYGPPAKTP